MGQLLILIILRFSKIHEKNLVGSELYTVYKFLSKINFLFFFVYDIYKKQKIYFWPKRVGLTLKNRPRDTLPCSINFNLSANNMVGHGHIVITNALTSVNLITGPCPF